jgi:hypothetical protein
MLLDVAERHVVAPVGAVPVAVDERIAVRRVAEREPLRAGAPLQELAAELLRLHLVRVSGHGR